MKKKYIEKLINIEVILYLFFGVIATILNIVLFYLFVIEWKMSTSLGNILDTIICVLFQYFTNRIWVFKSSNKGKIAIKEFFQFIIARSITAIIDQIFIVIGVDIVVVKFISLSQQSIFSIGIKILSNIIVVILNYIFSKYFIFNKNLKERDDD
jgi:cell wall teichoic acid glycosylation protein gtcA